MLGALYEIVLSLTIGFLLFYAGSEMTRRRLESEAISRGFAERNITTGQWQWKDELSQCR